MKSSSAALEFERAADIAPDRLESMRWLCRQLDRVRRAEKQSFVYSARGWAGNEVWYLIHGGRLEKAIPAPHEATSEQTAGTVLSRIDRFQEDRTLSPNTG